MTQNQLNIAIKHLLKRTDELLNSAKQFTMAHDQISSEAWTANMTASLVCGAIAETLMAIRDGEFTNAQSETKSSQL
jgi:hypothetical protein